MHEQSIIDAILQKLNVAGCTVKTVSLVCREDELKEHLQKDIAKGIRTADIIERSVVRLPLFAHLSTRKISADNKTAKEIAEEIAKC